MRNTMISFNDLVHSYFHSRHTQISSKRSRAVKYAVFVVVENLEGRALFSGMPDPGSTLATAFNVGRLTDATFQDFVGLDPNPSLHDPIDTYKFKMDAPGTLTVQLALDSKPADAFKAHVELVFDSNNNGQVDLGEAFFASPSSNRTNVSQSLLTGTYYLRVVSDLNSSNYHVRVNADYAGDTPNFARAMGSLDAGKTFNDFISSSADPSIFDAVDQYQFSISSTRSVFLVESQTGGMSDLSLYKDANNDGIAQLGELVTRNGAGAFLRVLATIDKGNYIVQVTASAVAGPYSLFAETRPDGAGNTLKSAKNLGTVNGLKHLDDSVSDQDPVDYYKFTASAAATVGASVSRDFGSDADLTLIRDANNNGIVDKNEILATATKAATGAKEFSKSITAGNYFLRVSHKPAMQAGKYFLTFHTDYAGSVPMTARNVGTLAGTRNFDDWSSGPFVGAISDTEDVYKFSLSSTKIFSAKMIGATNGQDVNLLLYRDKNNDGMLTSSELLASSTKVNSANEQITNSLGAGTYFVRVLGINGETNYHLSLKA